MASKLSRFFSELKRRKVTRVAVVYAVVGAGTAEAAQMVFEALELPPVASQVVTLLILFGFPVAIVLAWALEVTPDGIRRTAPAADADLPDPRGARRGALLGWGVAGLLLGVALWGFFGREDTATVAFAAVSEVEGALSRGDYLGAYQLARILPDAVPDSTRRSLVSATTFEHQFTSVPEGAVVSWRPYGDPDAEWEQLGTTPLTWNAPSSEAILLRTGMDGYVSRDVMLWDQFFPVPAAALRGEDEPEPRSLAMAVPPDLVERVIQLADSRLQNAPAVDVQPFLIDRYEVTNAEYREFVDDGGYERPQFWTEPFRRNGEAVSREDAMAEFVDETGRPGPATWVGGTFPEGTAEYPVTGISWYEAMAYANYRGRTLPSLYHWYVTAFPLAAEWIVPQSNIEGEGLAAVGQFSGVSPFGAYDMAGNAREWLINPTGDLRYTAGGGWSDPAYLFTMAEPQPPFDRSRTNGFRLMTHLGAPDAFAETTQAIDLVSRDLGSETPVSDEVFETFRALYAYDDRPLDARVEAVDTLNFGIRERISFDATYDGPRMLLYLYRPLDDPGPLQTIVTMPGANALTSTEDPPASSFFLPLLVRSGRAVALPIYMSTYARQNEYNYFEDPGGIERRDHVVMWYQDLARSLDYLQTRADVRSDRLGYFGVSWGGMHGNIMLALEDRFRAAVLTVAGLSQLPLQPMADPLNFAPRVQVPTIMLNGEYDQIFPLETSARVMFDLLGTPDEDKAFYVSEGGHIIPTVEITRETLNWFDRYLGPVR